MTLASRATGLEAGRKVVLEAVVDALTSKGSGDRAKDFVSTSRRASPSPHNPLDSFINSATSSSF